MNPEIFEKDFSKILLPPSHKHRKEQMYTIKGETLLHVLKDTVHLLLNIACLNNNRKKKMCLQVIKEVKIKKENHVKVAKK